MKLYDTQFRVLYSKEQLQDDVQRLASHIVTDYQGVSCLEVVCVLNGAFIFAADLVRALVELPLRVHFVRYRSYEGKESTGVVRSVLDCPAEVKGHPVLLVEDIVDTGLTVSHAMEALKEAGATEVKVATMFFKPSNYKGGVLPAYVGREVPDKFVVGYGMDYEELGRHLPHLYVEEKA